MKEENEAKKLTSVKLIPSLYQEFKKVAVDTQITLQKLVNRTIYLYNIDLDFRQRINTTIIPFPSGSVLQ